MCSTRNSRPRQRPPAPDGRRTGRIYKIILFGSYARGTWVDERNIGKGYQSDYDILVIVNRKEFTDVPRYWLAAEDRLMFDKAVKTPVEIIVHTLGDVNSQLKQGNYFFRDIREDGIALYEFEGTKPSGNRKHTLAEPGNLSPEEAYSKAKQYCDTQLPSALEFMPGFDLYMKRESWNKAAFMLHQATEHAYRAILLTLTLYSPAEHNINKLRGLAESLDRRLVEAWPRGRKPYDRYFQLLRRAYVEARYSPHYEITREELDWLGERVARLHELAEIICSERLEELRSRPPRKAKVALSPELRGPLAPPKIVCDILCSRANSREGNTSVPLPDQPFPMAGTIRFRQRHRTLQPYAPSKRVQTSGHKAFHNGRTTQPGGLLMEEDGFDWRSFWDLASPSKMVPVLLELYGTDADSAVKQCILTASSDGRDEDRRFWLAVASCLRNAQQPKNLTQEKQP